jgi:hypothetical protein
MKNLCAGLALGLAAAASASSSLAHASPAESSTDRAGPHGFDFEFGSWRVHHRVKRPSGEWVEYDGTATARPLMDGSANVEDNVFMKPGGGTTRGVAIRTYDAKTAQWAIWWIDSRDPHGALDPPVKGAFVDGVGTFYSDGIVNGKATRTRLTWSQITPTSAHWEQAYSTDAGKTWETNWIMEFTRAS